MTKAPAFGRILSLYVGPHRPFSVAALAALPEAPCARTIDSHRGGHTAPLFHDLLFYIRILPEPFAAEVLHEAGVTAVLKAHASVPGDGAGDGRSVMTEVAAQLHELARAMEDGRIDHRERGPLARRTRAVGHRLLGFAEALELMHGPIGHDRAGHGGAGHG